MGREPDRGNGRAARRQEEAVWVANIDDATITRIDPKTNEAVGEPIVIEGQPVGVAAGDGGVWVADLAGQVIWIDAESNEADEPISIGGSPQSLAFGDGALWVTDLYNGTVVRMEP